MGDVALTAPVVRAVDPEAHKILILSRSSYAEFFNQNDSAEVIKADLKGRHKGLTGLIRLVRDINRDFKISQVIDLHSVLRTWIIDLLFRFKGIKVCTIDKGRKAKKRFIKSKDIVNLPHTTKRYSDVFRRAGVNIGDPVIPSFRPSFEDNRKALEIFRNNVQPGRILIGISPFAKHKTKSWGVENISRLMSLLQTNYDVFFFLFGGNEEVAGLRSLATPFDNCYIIAGKHSTGTELEVISRLRVMISMDSANMHLAALSGTRTVSIWGGTHPLTGWAPSGNQSHIIIGVGMDVLECRPCTIYGRGNCIRKDIKYKCLIDIKPEMVYSKIKESGILSKE